MNYEGEQVTDSLTHAWLKLCLNAEIVLPADRLEMWKFMVGAGGPLNERVRVGRIALAELTGESYQVFYKVKVSDPSISVSWRKGED